jgi:hypothetical protein
MAAGGGLNLADTGNPPPTPTSGETLSVISGVWSSTNSLGVTTPIAVISAVNNTDGTITVTSSGGVDTVSRAAITGDISIPVASNVATLATVNAAPGTYGSATQVGQFTVNGKGLVTSATEVTITGVVPGGAAGGSLGGTYPNPTVVTNANLTGMVTSVGNATTVVTNANLTGPVTSVGNATTIANNVVTNANLAQANAFSILGNNTNTAANVQYLTVAQVNAMLDALEIIDVTQNNYAEVVLNNQASAAANVTALNTITTNAPAGSTLYFPPGVCYINAVLNGGTALTSNFTFWGNYGASYIVMIAVLTGTGNWITTNVSTANPTAFVNMSFASGTSANPANQTLGSVIEFGNTLQPLVLNCIFSGNGYTDVMFNCLDFTGSNSANGGVVANCNFGAFNGTAMNFATGQGSTSVYGNLIEGLNSQGRAVAGISVQTPTTSGGSVLIDNCDVIACGVNLNIIAGAGTTLGSVFVNNSFFDQALTSALLISGAGTVVRCRFLGSWFTVSASSSSANCINIATTGTSAHQGLEFENCWILNTPAGGGTPTGMNISAAGEIDIDGNQIAGWTGSGINCASSVNSPTRLNLWNNTIGPAGGVAGNATGVTLSGSFGNLMMTNNNLNGNTTPFVDTSTTNTSSQKTIKGNQGLPLDRPNNVTATAIPLTTVTNADSNGGFFFPPNSIRAGTMIRITCYVTCAATAQTLTPHVLFGTNNTNADTAVVSYANSAGTAALGAALIEVFVFFPTTTSIEAAIRFTNLNNAATGVSSTAGVVAFGTNAAVAVTTTANTWLGLYLSSATAAAVTVRSIVYEVVSQ